MIPDQNVYKAIDDTLAPFLRRIEELEKKVAELEFKMRFHHPPKNLWGGIAGGPV